MNAIQEALPPVSGGESICIGRRSILENALVCWETS